MDELQKMFQYGGNKVRVVEKEGDPWFVAMDVTAILGYTDGKTAIRDHCKYPILLKGVESTPLTSSPRGITIIPERDVYRLVMRSKLPAAEKFEEWVVSEVLPAIRKTGSYSSKIPQTMGEALLAAGQAMLKVEALQIAFDQQVAQIEEKETEIKTMRPKVLAHNRLSHSKGSQLISDVAKDLEIIPHKTLFTFLEANKWIFKRGTEWKANQLAQKDGMVEQKPITYRDQFGDLITRQQVKITPKGFAYLAEFFGETEYQEAA